MGEQVTNNLEAPVLDGQGGQTGEEANLEQSEIQTETGGQTESQIEGQTEGQTQEEGKGIPDDPKLLRAKMTQVSQENAEIKRRLIEAEDYRARTERLFNHPKFKQVYEQMAKEGEIQSEKQSLKYAEMTDEQKTAYNTLKPFLSLMLEEMGITPKLAQIESTVSTNAQREALKEQQMLIEGFYGKHPEAKTNPEVNKALANIINNGLNNGEIISLDNAWKIYVSDSAESKAKQKILEENKFKKEATLPKPNSASPAQIQTGKMSRRQAVEEALKTVGY